MIKKTLISVITITVLTAGLQGCSHKSTVPATVSQNSLPKVIQEDLSSYSTRQRHVTSPYDGGIQLPQIKGAKSIVVIDPRQKYAINQFASVWDMLKTKPEVIWINTTETQINNLWKVEGFHSNPLPSKQTMYLQINLPSPDAYNLTKKGWVELPGVLKSMEVKEWTGFFNGY